MRGVGGVGSQNTRVDWPKVMVGVKVTMLRF